MPKYKSINHTFSIVIPVYNSAAWINRSIQSIINARYDVNLYEIIVVDDGSTDNSLEIITSYQKRYANLQVHHKVNGNWGSVVNYVRDQKLVKNEYVLILDSDDEIQPNFFINVNQKIKNADMLMMSFYIKGQHFKQYTSPYWFINHNVKLKNRLTPAFAPMSVVFKKDIFYAAPRLIEHVSYQDSLLVYGALVNSKVVRFTNKTSGIYWRNRIGNTMTAAWSDKRLEQEKVLHDELYKIGLDTGLVWRIFMWGYAKKAQEHNYKILMRSRPKGMCLPIYIRWLYWILYAVILRRNIRFTKKSKS